MSDADAFAAARSADRPRGHAGTSETETAIFDATEQLLEEVPLHDLSVAQIIAEAGISRATFYFYFSSKFAVVSGLVARISDELFDVIRPWTERPDDVSPEEAMNESLSAAVRLWAAHRAPLRAVHEHWNTTDELRELWVNTVGRFTEAIARELDRQRLGGLARPGAESTRLAATLVWATQCCLYVAGLGVDPNQPGDEEDALASLLEIWTGALYRS